MDVKLLSREHNSINFYHMIASHFTNAHLWLNNYRRHGQEGVEIGSDVEIKWAAHLLQISSNGLQRALTSRLTEARAERVFSPLTIDQALDARDAFGKALYSALFNW